MLGPRKSSSRLRPPLAKDSPKEKPDKQIKPKTNIHQKEPLSQPTSHPSMADLQKSQSMRLQLNSELQTLRQEFSQVLEQKNYLKRNALENSKKAADFKQQNRKLKKELQQLADSKKQLQATLARLVSQKPVHQLRGGLLQAQLAGLKNINLQLSHRLKEISRLTVELESQYDKIQEMSDHQFGLLHIQASIQSFRSRLADAKKDASMQSFVNLDLTQKENVKKHRPLEPHLFSLVQALRKVTLDQRLSLEGRKQVLQIERQMWMLQKNLLLNGLVPEDMQTVSDQKMIGQAAFWQQVKTVVEANLAEMDQPQGAYVEALKLFARDKGDFRQQLNDLIASYCQTHKKIDSKELGKLVWQFILDEVVGRERLTALAVLDSALCRRRIKTIDSFCKEELAKIQTLIKEEIFQPFHEINQLHLQHSQEVLRLLDGKRPFEQRVVVGYLTKLAVVVDKQCGRIVRGLNQVHKASILKQREEHSLFQLMKKGYQELLVSAVS